MLQHPRHCLPNVKCECMKADNGSESGRWPPRRCEMPDLSNLSGKLTIDYFLNYAFGNTELQMSGPGQAQFLNFIRLVDKTLLEYEPARFDLQNYVNSDNRTSLFMRCVDHMENCVDSLHRSFLHLDGLRTSIYRERQRTNEPLPDIHRDELPKSSNRKRIDNIRDAIQHMDDRIRACADRLASFHYLSVLRTIKWAPHHSLIHSLPAYPRSLLGLCWGFIAPSIARGGNSNSCATDSNSSCVGSWRSIQATPP